MLGKMHENLLAQSFWGVNYTCVDVLAHKSDCEFNADRARTLAV